MKIGKIEIKKAKKRLSAACRLLRPTKSQMIVFVVLTLLAVGYFPLFKCIDDHDASAKVCKLMGRCKVDFYYPLSWIILGYDDGGFGCPSDPKTAGDVMLAGAGIMGIAYLGSCLGFRIYERYRDV